MAEIIFHPASKPYMLWILLEGPSVTVPYVTFSTELVRKGFLENRNSDD